jgi:hypothetical protein
VCSLSNRTPIPNKSQDVLEMSFTRAVIRRSRSRLRDLSSDSDVFLESSLNVPVTNIQLFYFSVSVFFFVPRELPNHCTPVFCVSLSPGMGGLLVVRLEFTSFH